MGISREGMIFHSPPPHSGSWPPPLLFAVSITARGVFFNKHDVVRRGKTIAN